MWHCCQFQAVLQDYMQEQIDQLGSYGLRVPNPRHLPQVAFHNHRQHPGNVLEEAYNYGQQTFGTAPEIIFVMLPTTGKLQPST